jgi:polysaccharide biosynthesis transport protein
MLQVTSKPVPTVDVRPLQLAAEQMFGIAELLAFVRRYARPIGYCVIAALAAGGAYLALATPVYVAQAQVFIDPKRPQATNGVTEFGLLQLDSSQLESQIQIVKSERVSRHVVRELRLAEEREFNTPASSFLSLLLPFLEQSQTVAHREPAARPGAEIAGETTALARFAERLSVRRIGQSYVLEIGFWSEDGQMAARVANAVTAAYIRDQIVTRLDAAQRGGEILEDRIQTLRGQLATVDAAVRSGMIQLDSFPIADGRVITSASLPLGKSWPKSSMVLALAALAGAFVGGVGALLRNAVDSRVRSRKQIENGLQVPLLGALPTLSRLSKLRLSAPRNVLAQVVQNPHSSFSGELRSIKTEIDLAMLDASIQCIGIVSALPGEGKSTLASNLAYAFSAAGRRVLLMDCDNRTRTLSRSLAGSWQYGLFDSVTGAAELEKAVLDTDSAGPAFLPLILKSPVANFCDVLASEGMRRTLQQCRQTYDLVVVDLPAVSVGAEARALSPLIDAVLVVAEYDRTPIEALGDAIQLLERSPIKLLGVVLNKFVR